MTISNQPAEEVLGNQLTFTQVEDGTVYVPLKSLCESLRIDYEKQRSKVRNSKDLQAELVSVPGTDGRHRKMLCLPLEAIGEWASTIAPSAVPPEVKEGLMSYLEEPDEALEAHETGGAAADPGMILVTPDELAELVVQAAEGMLKRILGNNLLPRLDELKRIRFGMLQREIAFIEDVAADSPAFRAKARTYIDSAKTDYELWLADFEKDTSHNPVH
ncbi:MAG: phage antirepressor N-terminal domain-containing protein [Desulfomonilaceae bacterium]